MFRNLRVGLFVPLLFLMLSAPARAGVISHNGFDYPGTDQNGSGEVDVLLACTVNEPALATCFKFFEAVGQSHVIDWSGRELLETIFNNTNVAWSDFHFAFQDMDLLGAGRVVPDGTVIEATSSSLDFQRESDLARPSFRRGYVLWQFHV